MPIVFIPALLRSLSGGQRQTTVSGATVAEVIDALDALYPGMRDRLVEGDRLRSGLAVAVDDAFGKCRLSDPVNPDSEVHFFPAIAGGARSMPDTLVVSLRSRSQVRDVDSRVSWGVSEERESWRTEHTALVLCDVWDRHPCGGAVLRLEAMLPRMQRVVTSLRDRGSLIVHAPSETMAFYEGTPARLRTLVAPSVTLPPPIEHADPPLPIDASDGGCDTLPYVPRKAWSRQHPTIEIDQDRDVISDNGAELYSVYQDRGIDQVLIMGVHTNMCILNRTFAIKTMVRAGVRIALIRDLTDAMYNPLKPPFVSHDDGTQLVVEYIEKFWCPTIDSGQLLGD